MNNLQIIKSKLDDGRTEYQVSNGGELERTYSYDFYTLSEAEACLNEIVSCDDNYQEDRHNEFQYPTKEVN